ncbi:MAG: histidinol dehydrogenase [Pseudomonadota bacterium]|nr:histidinol dehydrogenase [Pseudomonadota bacterium]
MATRLKSNDPGFESAFQRFLGAKRGSGSNVNAAVSKILTDVKNRGDAAVIEYTSRFDNYDLDPSTMAFRFDEISSARDKCSSDVLEALELAANRITAYHQHQVPEDLDYIDDVGINLGYRWTPIQSVGMYVPGGTAVYPSSVLMNALPAKIAGVERLAMVVPTPDGEINPMVLAAASIAGIDEIYRVGGAQAIGALAYGTETINLVDKIIGPGNAYVAAAKRQVFGTVGIDMIAGPSEILVIADAQNDPAWIAADLLSQAEHDPNAQSILITDNDEFAIAVERAVESQLKHGDRAQIAASSWQDFGAVIVVSDLNDAVALTDQIAPEHLEIATESPKDLAVKVRNAGAIFLGRYSPEALGDYIAGTNHVLPTGRSARFSSGLGVLDFLKRTSIIGSDASALAKLGPAAVSLAKAEGLDAHGYSLRIRLNRQEDIDS